MGNVAGSAVGERAALPGYERLEGAIPVAYPPGLGEPAAEARDVLEVGAAALSEILDLRTPELEALLVADEDWGLAPRENERPYPPGLPYFTRAATPPALVLPETLSPAFQPRTATTGALVLWHELAHAYLLREPVPRTPAWLRELLPQALCAAAARRTGLPLEEHLRETDRNPGFSVRSFAGRADAEEQMAFQKVLLALGDAALERFGEGFLRRLAYSLWEQTDIVGEGRAEELLADSLGPGGREWLASRPEF
ncbi:MAG TPA: hypothetical protein VHH10_14430 [Rubrobacteraceae bacterium]|nr:hypothetical protein [Rubrobacteraceae bacterium]